MSQILDTLRRGRTREAPRPKPKGAQTDAVLQTFGYGRPTQTSAEGRFSRPLKTLLVTVAAAIALWLIGWALPRLLWPASGRDAAAPGAVGPSGLPVVPSARNRTESARVADERVNAPASTGPVSLPEQPVVPVVPDGPLRKPVDALEQDVANVAVPRQPPTRPAARPGPRGSRLSSDDHFNRAVIAQRLGDFESALYNYRQVLDRDDLNVEAHNNLGLLYRDKGLFIDAAREFHRAIAIDPKYVRARNNLGVLLLGERQLDAAAAQFHAALSLDRRNVESLVNLSIVERELGRRQAARQLLLSGLEIDPRNAEAHYNLGLLEDEAGNSDQALIHYRAFLQQGTAVYPALAEAVRRRAGEIEAKN